MKKVAWLIAVMVFVSWVAGGAAQAAPVTSFVVPSLVDELNNALNGNAGDVSANGGTVTVVENGAGPYRQSIITLASVPVVVVGASGIGFGGVKVYDFPQGHIWVEKVVADDLVSTEGSGISGGAGGDYGIGTVIVAGTSLSSTYVDLGPSTSADPITNAVDVTLSAAVGFDGSATAKDANLNMLIDDADIAGTCTNLVSGTITITWTFLGDD